MTTDAEKLTAIEAAVVEWMQKQGHDRCWYYPEIFQRILDVLELTEAAPPQYATRLTKTEFEAGCRRYAADLYDGPRVP